MPDRPIMSASTSVVKDSPSMALAPAEVEATANLLTSFECCIYPRYREYTGPNGLSHVRRVVHFATLIASLECPADQEAVMVGAAFHDIGRVPCCNEAEARRLNADHGERGALIARPLLRLHFPLVDIELLCYAIEKHNLGLVSDNPVVGAIWDADRLDLFRIKDDVTTSRFSTAAATLLLSYARALSSRAR